MPRQDGPPPLSTRQLFKYLRESHSIDLPSAMQEALEIDQHHKRVILRPSQRQLLTQPAPAEGTAVAIRVVLRLVALYYLQSAWNKLMVEYGESCLPAFEAMPTRYCPEVELLEGIGKVSFATAHQINRAHAAYDRQAEMVREQLKINVVEERRLALLAQHAEAVDVLCATELSATEQKLLRSQVTLESLKGHNIQGHELLLDRFEQLAADLEAVNWRGLNEECLVFLEEHSEYVEASPSAELPQLLDALTAESTLGQIEAQRALLTKLEEEAERFPRQMREIASHGSRSRRSGGAVSAFAA